MQTSRLMILIGAVLALSLLASPLPDGLERTAELLSFHAKAQENPIGVFADYSLPGLSELPSSLGAGLLGALVVSGCLVALGRFLAGKHVSAALPSRQSQDKHAMER